MTEVELWVLWYSRRDHGSHDLTEKQNESFDKDTKNSCT